MDGSYTAVTGTRLSTQNTAFQRGKRDKEAEWVSALTILRQHQGWDVVTCIPAVWEQRSIQAWLLHSHLPPSSAMPMDGEGSGQFVILPAGQLLAQEADWSNRGGQWQLQDLRLQIQLQVSSSCLEALAERSCPQPEFQSWKACDTTSSCSSSVR